MMRTGKSENCVRLIAMLLLVISIGFGVTEKVHAENQITIQTTYADGKDSIPDIINYEILPQIGLPSGTIITYLIHFTDGDYYYDNGTGTFKKASGSSGSSDSSSSKSLSAPSSVKVKLLKYNEAKITWKKVSGAKSYNVYRKVASGDFNKIKNVSKTTYTDSKLEAGAKITYYVVAVNGSGEEGKKSATKAVTTIGKVSKVEVQNKGASSALVVWKKTTGASGYQVSASSVKGKVANSGKVKASVLKKILKVDTQKVKYYRVRAFQTVGKKTVYGPWSDIKTLTSNPENIIQEATSKATVDPSNVTDISVKINSKHKCKGKYCDQWFFDVAETMNYHLVKLSALASASTYGGKNGKVPSPVKMLQDCGFDDAEKIFSGTMTETGSSTWDDNHHCTMYSGTKHIGNKTIIALIISGYSGVGYEWISNFNLGKGDEHRGFSKAADEIMKYLEKYTFDANTYIWITGHSRGGALTNIVARRIMDNYKETKVFAYGFATPNVISSTKTNNTNRIINYVNSGDFVPEVPPAREKWGYGKNGVVYTFDANSKVKKLYKKYTGKKYAGLTEGKRNTLIDFFCAAGISKEKYDAPRPEAGLDGSYSAMDYCQNGLALAMIKKEEIKNKGIERMTAYTINNYISPTFRPVFTDLTLFLKLNVDSISQAHEMETYLAYVNSVSIWKD